MRCDEDAGTLSPEAPPEKPPLFLFLSFFGAPIPLGFCKGIPRGYSMQECRKPPRIEGLEERAGGYPLQGASHALSDLSSEWVQPATCSFFFVH